LAIQGRREGERGVNLDQGLRLRGVRENKILLIFASLLSVAKNISGIGQNTKYLSVFLGTKCKVKKNNPPKLLFF
jgi:hypothetical protein